jgi:hypothetical protein
MNKIIKVSHNDTQIAVTIQTIKGYEIHLYNENGYVELHSRADNLETALEYHQYLCEKCDIKNAIK